MKIFNLKQGSPEWHLFRTTHIGASESAAILGLSPYGTCYEVWLEKTLRRPGFTGNVATKAGNLAEDKARAEYEMLHGDFEEFTPVVAEHDELKFISASLDGWNESLSRFVEIKYPSQKTHDEALQGQVPRHYWVQVQHQYLVSGASRGDFWSYREGNAALVTVEKDQKFIDEVLVPALIDFELKVINDIAPPLTDKDAKWLEGEEIDALFEKLFTLDKAEQKKLGAQIIDLAGHKKVRSKLGIVTTVESKGREPYLLIKKIDQ